MSTEKKKKLTKQEMIDKLRQLSEKDLQTICGGSNIETKNGYCEGEGNGGPPHKR